MVKRRKTVYNVREINDFWMLFPSLVVNIRDVSRSPMSDHRYPPPLRHVATPDQRPLILDSRQHNIFLVGGQIISLDIDVYINL